MHIRLALPGNRYLTHTRLLLGLLNPRTGLALNGRATFRIGSCTVTPLITKAKDTCALVEQGAVEAAIAPDEWVLEHLAAAPHSLEILGPVAWLNVRLSVFGLAGATWPPLSPPLVVTPFPNLLRKHCEESAAPLKQLYSVAGTTEAFIPAVADFGFDVVETGATLSANGLVELHTTHHNLCLSLVCRQVSDPAWDECADQLLRQANEARILNTA